MITITRDDRQGGWVCVIDVKETPAKYFVVHGSHVDSPHVKGPVRESPHEALDAALTKLGLEVISNPPDAGRPR